MGASVKSLVPFPVVLATMNSNLSWLQQLGYAFATLRADVSPRRDAFAARRWRTHAKEGFNGHVFTKKMELARVHPAFATATERVVCGAIGGSKRQLPARCSTWTQ
jgi:Protein of unknown function (DUF3300)